MTQTPYNYLFAGHSYIHPVSKNNLYPIQTDPKPLPNQMTNNQLYNKLVEVLTIQGQKVSGNQDVAGRGVDNAARHYAYMLSALYYKLNNNNELKHFKNQFFDDLLQDIVDDITLDFDTASENPKDFFDDID